MNYYFCDACHYCFEAESLPDRCPDCGKCHQIFGKSHLDETAQAYHLPVLARLPIDPAVAAAQSVIPYHTGAAAYYTAQGITPAGPETGASPEQEAAA